MYPRALVSTVYSLGDLQDPREQPWHPYDQKLELTFNQPV